MGSRPPRQRVTFIVRAAPARAGVEADGGLDFTVAHQEGECVGAGSQAHGATWEGFSQGHGATPFAA